MSKFGLYFHTLRHLRPIQIAARLSLPLRQPRADLRPAPELRRRARPYVAPIALAPSMTAPDTFRFLNLEGRCAAAADWNPHGVDKLWIYNLHYFDDLNAAAAESRSAWHEALLRRWVAENPPGCGDGWEPYPTSRRIVNWVKWVARGNVLPGAAVHSLAIQARWLARRLEYHILGNHLFANAKALLYASLYFSGAEAERWGEKAGAIVAKELRRQVLGDGGHFELSPMYHALILEDLLDLINLQQAYGLPAVPQWRDAASRMMRWLRAINQPDGEIPFFNDSAFDIAPRCDALERYAQHLSLEVESAPRDGLLVLADSGYVCMYAGQAYLLCDCGPVGASYQPGHAHADTLSFELSLGKRRIFVNSGTSRYGVGAERQRQRGTAAHNTVVVDDKDSSEVWAGFRVARRARASIGEMRADQELAVQASHDGYRRLPGRNEHYRRWELRAQALSIEDRVTGPFKSANAFLHLHPDIEPSFGEGRSVLLSRSGSLVATVEFDGAATIDVIAGSWHPRFGVAIENRCIRVGFAGEMLMTRIRWTDVA